MLVHNCELKSFLFVRKTQSCWLGETKGGSNFNRVFYKWTIGRDSSSIFRSCTCWNELRVPDTSTPIKNGSLIFLIGNFWNTSHTLIIIVPNIYQPIKCEINVSDFLIWISHCFIGPNFFWPRLNAQTHWTMLLKNSMCNSCKLGYF